MGTHRGQPKKKGDRVNIKGFKYSIVDFFQNILFVGLLAIISIVYVKEALGLDHHGRISNGILWLVMPLPQSSIQI